MRLVPPVIYHRGQKPDSWIARDVVREAAEAVHLTERGERLLEVYALATSGFSPAVRYIEDKTGISSKKIPSIRKELVEMGLISYSKERHVILVDWNRIRLYASLDPELTNRYRKNIHVSPACGGAFSNEKLGRYSLHDRTRRKLSPAQRKFYSFVEGLTEEEWQAMMRGIGFDISDETFTFEEELDLMDTVTWDDLGIDESCPKRYGPITYATGLPF